MLIGLLPRLWVPAERAVPHARRRGGVVGRLPAGRVGGRRAARSSAACSTRPSRRSRRSRRPRASRCSCTRICTATTCWPPQREPWLAIDPKPLTGEREFAVAPIVRSTELGHSRRAVLRRLDRLTAELGLDRDRARGWTIGQTIAWAIGGARRAPGRRSAGCSTRDDPPAAARRARAARRDRACGRPHVRRPRHARDRRRRPGHAPRSSSPTARPGAAWVAVDANDSPIAYILTAEIDAGLHIEQVSVAPRPSRRADRRRADRPRRRPRRRVRAQRGDADHVPATSRGTRPTTRASGSASCPRGSGARSCARWSHTSARRSRATPHAW